MPLEKPLEEIQVLTGAQQELQIMGAGRCCQIFMVAGMAGMAEEATGCLRNYKEFFEVDFAAEAAKRSLVLLSTFCKSTRVNFLAAVAIANYKQL